MKEITTVGTFIFYKNKFLILHRLNNISQPNTWGLPAGRVENNETFLETAKREILEETGLKINEKEMIPLNNLTWNFPEIIVHFPTFILKINKEFIPKLNSKEHNNYKWVTIEECYKKKDLIHGFHDLLEKSFPEFFK